MGKEIRVCPHCGRKLSGQEFLPNVQNLPQMVGISYDPVAGRFLCPDCNYSGLPILLSDEEHGKVEFSKEELDPPLKRGNPHYFRMIMLTVLCGLAGTFFFSLTPFATRHIFLAGFAILEVSLIAYTFLIVPKYKAAA
ncbi:MAG: hypothetical protein ABII71_01570 [Candidatus Micrarchaeota archaeon]